MLTTRKRGRPSSRYKQEDVCDKQCTRTKRHTFDKTQCIFCQPDNPREQESIATKDEPLISCLSTNKGSEIAEIVAKSQNPVWAVRLADVLTPGDLHARDIKYHQTCRTTNWEKFIQRPKRKAVSQARNPESSNDGDNVMLIAAEVQFFCMLQQQIDNGLFINIAKAQTLYNETLTEFDLADTHIPTRKTLKHKIECNVENVVVTPSYGSKPSQIHSADAGKAAINAAAGGLGENSPAKLKLLFKCAKQLRSVIQINRNEGWKFSGSLKDSIGASAPNQLLIFIQWVLQGPKSPQTEKRKADIERSASIISQNILHNYKSDRQVTYNPASSICHFSNTYETPTAVGLSLYSHHMHRSKNVINILSAAKVGISYHRVNDITTQIANNAIETMKKNNGIICTS